MEVTHTETNRGQPAIVVNGILYRISNTLQADDVVYRCTTKSCKMSITTDKDGITVLKTKNQYTCESSQSDRKTEAHVLRIRSRNKSGDITKRPSQIIRTELQTMDEQTLQSADLDNHSRLYLSYIGPLVYLRLKMLIYLAFLSEKGYLGSESCALNKSSTVHGCKYSSFSIFFTIYFI